MKCTTKFGLEKIRKRFHEISNTHGFNITIETGVIRTEFLDVMLDLNTGHFQPYRKPNAEILCIDNMSNHPEYIKKELPNMIEKRLSSLSSDENTFNAAVQPYNAALEDKGYKRKLKFNSEVGRKAKNRPRKNIIFYNPPFCSSVVDNIGAKSLRIVRKHFGRDNPFHKVLNKNTMKLLYSCMGNIKTIISAHNRKVLEEFQGREDKNKKKCN